MAEQNRKTRQEQRTRAIVETAVDLFLAYLHKTDTLRDIAWEGRNILGMALEFNGQTPGGSGFSGFCKLAGKIDRFNATGGVTEQEVQAATAMALMGDKQVAALCVDRALRGRTRVLAVDPLRPEHPITRYWDDRECAHYLRCSVKQFQRRVSAGYARLERIMGLAEQRAA